MKLTVPWLKKHLNTKNSLDQIVGALTNIGLEVEEVVKPSANLKLFKRAENLNFKLLSDSNGEVARSFGVPQSKGGSIQKIIQGERFTLQRGTTTKRWTFIISKKGEIIYKIDKVNAAKDSKDALNFISNL